MSNEIQVRTSNHKLECDRCRGRDNTWNEEAMVKAKLSIDLSLIHTRVQNKEYE